MWRVETSFRKGLSRTHIQTGSGRYRRFHAVIGKNSCTQEERRSSMRVMTHLGANRIAPASAAIIGIAGCFVLLLTLTSCGVISARMYDNETAAIAEVRTIQAAQTRHFAQFGRWAGSLKELESVGMIDAELSSGHKTGYRYQLTQAERGYTISVTPNAFNESGSRSFYSDQTMVIHEHRGPAMATAGDPALPLK